jgi:hypothetical protein
MTRLTVLFAAALQAVQAPATGSLAGCITDQARYGIPGAAVTVTAADARQVCVETDQDGCYEVKDLRPGPYRVTGRLLGFDRITKDGVNVASGTAARFDSVMSVSGICDCIQVVPPTLANIWMEAAEVLHIRISEPAPESAAQAGTCTHVATVLHALTPQSRPASSIVRGFELQEIDPAPPYHAGQEMVIFTPRRNCCRLPGPAFVLQDGRVQKVPSSFFSRYLGMSTGALLGELRALSGTTINRD